MSLTTHQLLKFINSRKHFSSAEVLSFFHGNDNKKKKNKAESDINRSVNLLIQIGYIEKSKKGTFHLSPEFMRTGQLKPYDKDNSVVELESIDVLIPANETSGAHINDLVEIEITGFTKNFIFARVIGIVKKAKKDFVAVINRTHHDLIFFRLIDHPKESDVVCKTPAIETKDGELYIVELTGKTLNGRSECRVIRPLKGSEDETDFERITIKHSLPSFYGKYNRKELLKKIPAEELSKRVDFTKLLTVTIDGDTAKDFDDAVSLVTNNGAYELYVHIADVSAYVEKGSDLDKEALHRGNSYYLGNKVIPMLPETLSNDLCSLTQKDKKLTFSAVLTYDSDFRMKSYYITRSLIKVNKRLTYKTSQELIDKRKKDKYGRLMSELAILAMGLKQNRLKKGRVDLSLTDTELYYDKGKFKDIRVSQRLLSHQIIEECMLSANEAVARELKEKNIPSLYRVHEDISNESLDSLKKFLARFGVRIDAKKKLGQELQRIVESMKGKPYEHVVNLVILKSMMQAYYGNEPLGHFGLGFKNYTHFTSPIRRYSDLVVHRCMKALLDNSQMPYSRTELENIGQEVSSLERIAQKAERDLMKIKACRILSEHLGEEFDGVISGVSRFGIYVTLLDKPIEGMIPLKYMMDDYYIVNEDELTVVGRRLKKRFTLGDKLRIRIIKSDHISMQIDFELKYKYK